MLIDISRTIGLDDIPYPGDPPTAFALLANIQLDGYKLTQLSMTLHAGTHLDAPSHFISGGSSIEQYSPDTFTPICHVIELMTLSSIPPVILDGVQIQPGEAVLFKTVNGELDRGGYVERHAHIPLATAQRLIELQASIVGIDYISVERPNGEGYPVHRALLGAGILLLEDVDLRHVLPGRYRLLCLPQKVLRGEAAPCRAVLMPARGAPVTAGPRICSAVP
ncbi:cyclase family protein [bacterium]|nr:cyclase family protein [bacterium]